MIASRATLTQAIERTEASVRLLKMTPLNCRHRRIDVTREINRLDELKRIEGEINDKSGTG